MTMASGYSGGAPTMGATVRTADGDELGTVKEVLGTCFKVDVSMRPDYWLASDTIASADANGVRLTVTKEHLDAAKVESPEHSGVHRHVV